MSKRSWIIALTGVNLFLLAVLFLSSFAPAPAQAQSRGSGRNGDFVMITGMVKDSLDVVYVIDRPAGLLYVYQPNTKNGQLMLMDFSNLTRVFNKQ